MLKCNELSSHKKTQRKLNIFYSVGKRASLKSVHTVEFQGGDILKTMGTVKSQWLAGITKEEGLSRQSTEKPERRATSLNNPLLVDTCLYACVQTHRRYNTNNGCLHKLWFSAIIMCQAWIINCHKCRWWGLCMCEGRTCMESYLYFLLNFAMNFNILIYFFWWYLELNSESPTCYHLSAPPHTSCFAFF